MFWKKKIKDIWHRNQSLPICVYTFMLILNFHLIEINTGNICYNRVYFGKISSHLYISLCLLLALILQKTPSCFALLKLLHRLPSSLLLPNNHPSINQIPCSPCKAPQGSIPYYDSVYWSLGSMFPSRDQFVPMYPNFQLTGQTKWASSLNFKTQAW